MTETKPQIAYFSAEIAISPSLHTYSGGLGVLAGDHIKASADLGLPLCAITLLYKEGYFKQRMDEDGRQREHYPRFEPHPLLERLPVKITLPLRGRDLTLAAWRYSYRGQQGHEVPVYFLDSDLPENKPEDRIITLRLYSGDKNHRILQEAVLGFGGIRLLDTLGLLNDIETFHMNEGHAAFLTLELLRRAGGDEEAVRRRCLFTTHTPVPAGHDHFSVERCRNLLNDLLPTGLKLPSLVLNSRLHMTELGLHFSRAANAVSRLHQSTAQAQFPMFSFDYVTNGVYHPYWVGKLYRELFDRRFTGWRQKPDLLLSVDELSAEELWHAHQGQKAFLLDYANAQTQRSLSEEVLTIGFARRAAAYKRARLIFRDLDRLVRIGQGRIQLIFAGKAHPRDEKGKAILQEIYQNAQKLFGKVKVIFLENYNLWLGRLITSGVDVWLNTPLRPNEASGTSGMKAALNGTPNLSILDGWWAEACRPGENGWAIGDPDHPDDDADADALYRLLEEEVIPAYYEKRDYWSYLMRESIKTGVQFTAHRMVREYAQKFYHIKPKAH